MEKFDHAQISRDTLRRANDKRNGLAAEILLEQQRYGLPIYAVEEIPAGNTVRLAWGDALGIEALSGYEPDGGNK